MSTAPAEQSVPITQPEKHYIDGQWVAPASGGLIDVINPATEELYVSVAEATEPDIDRCAEYSTMVRGRG